MKQRRWQRTPGATGPWLTSWFYTNLIKDEATGCWNWSGYRIATGYGQMKLDGSRKRVLTHRWSWEFHNGPVPTGLCVLHRCDNPPCCNPAHLWLGTKADNAADCLKKGRLGKRGRWKWTTPGGPPGERRSYSKLTNNAVRVIRKASTTGNTRRDLAARYGVSITAIIDVQKRKTWKHLP